MKVLVIDVGGTSVKFRAEGARVGRSFPSGNKMTPGAMVENVLAMTGDWSYDAVSLGIPGPIIHGRPAAHPPNLGPGWVGFDYEKFLGKPVKIINDAAMQALGSYRGGRMLFVGLGTGLGSSMILDGVIVPLELGDLLYKNTNAGKALGKMAANRNVRAWRTAVNKIVSSLAAAFRTDYMVIGGGNVRKLKKLPVSARLGSNNNAFIGGVRLWGTDSMKIKPRKHTWVIT